MRRLLLAFLLTSTSAWAAVVQQPHSEAELVSDVASVTAGKPFWVALRLKTDNGWHSYWRNPGDSGLATTVQLTLPPGFQAGPLEWPVPHRMETLPLVSFGYSGEVVLATRITPPKSLTPGQAVKLAAKASWLVCQDICIPGKAQLELELPGAEPRAELIEKWLARVPRADEAETEWKTAAVADARRLALDVTPPAGTTLRRSMGVEFFPYDSEPFELSARPRLTIADAKASIALTRAKDATAPLERLHGVVVVRAAQDDDARLVSAFEIDVEVKRGQLLLAGDERADESQSLPKMFLFALLGGLILNLMPCVFPVLSIKILGFMQQAKESPKTVRWHGLAFSAGVLGSFWALAGALLALQSGGQRLGWGFQLQTPGFLAALACLFFLLGLNLLGAFEIGSSLMGVGSRALERVSGRSAYAGSFLSGVLATVVATPCTAPFMGSALGFALTQPPAVALFVFTGLALGMAAPYLLLSLNPGWMKALPRPGRWMETLKQALSFPLFATVVWLLWALAQQSGPDGVAAVGVALLLFSFGIWLSRRFGAARLGFLLFLIIGALWLARAFSDAGIASGPAGSSRAAAGAWQSWSPEKLAELRAQGKPVLVDFTAAWCISCQVNERVVLNRDDVQARFKELGVTLLKADWTSRDPRITEALAQLGRSGVPAYALYGRDAKAPPLLLPEVLTRDIVFTALEQALNPQ